MITVSKIQSLTSKKVPTEKCLKNIQNKMVMHIKKKMIVTFGSQYQKLKHLRLKMSELKSIKNIFKTAWSCKNDCNIGYAYKKEKVCNIWITVSKTQTFAIKNVRTKNCLKNIQNKMVM